MEFLLAATLSCADGKWILDGLAASDISKSTRSELIVTILADMPNDCSPEQYQAGDRRNP